MKISVIVPVYNKEVYIERCIRSILAQSYGEFELIVVDDGSTDESISIVQQIEDPRITIISQPNGGPGSARNLGIRHSTGDLLAFLDADDEWLPEYLNESIRLLNEAPYASAVVSGYYVYPEGRSTEPMWKRRGIVDGTSSLTPESRPMKVVYQLAYMSSWSTVAKRETIVRWGGFYDRDRCLYAEDAWLWLQILLNETVYFNTRPLIKFHREASDLSNLTTGPRPIEPFLNDPAPIYKSCPPELGRLLEKVLAIRAFKTSCMLGYWGEWKKALTILGRFISPRVLFQPYLIPALLLSTPPGAILARLYRESARAPSRLPAVGHLPQGKTVLSRGGVHP